MTLRGPIYQRKWTGSVDDVPWAFGSPRISDEGCRLAEVLDGSSVYARDSAID